MTTLNSLIAQWEKAKQHVLQLDKTDLLERVKKNSGKVHDEEYFQAVFKRDEDRHAQLERIARLEHQIKSFKEPDPQVGNFTFEIVEEVMQAIYNQARSFDKIDFTPDEVSLFCARQGIDKAEAKEGITQAFNHGCLQKIYPDHKEMTVLYRVTPIGRWVGRVGYPDKLDTSGRGYFAYFCLYTFWRRYSPTRFFSDWIFSENNAVKILLSYTSFSESEATKLVLDAQRADFLAKNKSGVIWVAKDANLGYIPIIYPWEKIEISDEEE